MRAGVLFPVGLENSSAPQRLLDLVFCSCKMGCMTATASSERQVVYVHPCVAHVLYIY